MRNKKKDLILDFTSLLDIVLLLLFFFILFSKMGADVRAKNAETEAQKSKNTYDSLVEETTALREKLEHDIVIVDQLTPQEAREIVNFNSGNNLKILLLDAGDSSEPLVLKAVLNKEIIGECLVTDKDDTEAEQENDVSAEKMVDWLAAGGVNKDDVIMCDFVYDADMPRTSEACDKLDAILFSLQREYGYRRFYFSSTDLSIGSDNGNKD